MLFTNSVYSLKKYFFIFFILIFSENIDVNCAIIMIKYRFSSKQMKMISLITEMKSYFHNDFRHFRQAVNPKYKVAWKTSIQNSNTLSRDVFTVLCQIRFFSNFNMAKCKTKYERRLIKISHWLLNKCLYLVCCILKEKRIK